MLISLIRLEGGQFGGAATFESPERDQAFRLLGHNAKESGPDVAGGDVEVESPSAVSVGLLGSPLVQRFSQVGGAQECKRMAGGSRASDDDRIAVENLRDPGWRGGGDDGANGLEINGVHVEAEGVAAGIGEIDLGLFGVVGEIAHEGPGVHGVGLLKGGRGDSGLGSAVYF